MVSKKHVERKISARRGGSWYPWTATDPNRDNHREFSPCWEKCKKYTRSLNLPCAYGNCMEIYCGECRRCLGGMGPVGCPCDYYGNVSGSKGHMTPEEQISRTYHIVPNTDPEAWENWIVTPSRKRKPSKR